MCNLDQSWHSAHSRVLKCCVLTTFVHTRLLLHDNHRLETSTDTQHQTTANVGAHGLTVEEQNLTVVFSLMVLVFAPQKT